MQNSSKRILSSPESLLEPQSKVGVASHFFSSTLNSSANSSLSDTSTVKESSSEIYSYPSSANTQILIPTDKMSMNDDSMNEEGTDFFCIEVLTL